MIRQCPSLNKRNVMSKQKLNILLVDDDEDDYIITQDLLSEIVGMDITLDWIDTYEAALDIIYTHQHDVYLIDYFLGPHNGLELLKEAIEYGCEPPFILLAGQVDRSVGLEAVRAGAADCLIKGRFDVVMLERSILYAIEHAQTLATLRESEERYRSLVELSPDAIVVHNQQGIMFSNTAGAKVLGAKSSEDLVGMQFTDFVRSDVKSKVWKHINQKISARKDIVSLETRFIPLGGQMIDVEVASTSVMYQGKSAIQTVVRDITERKYMEHKIQRSSERRRRQVQTGTEIAQQIAAAPALDELFQRVVSLVQEQFGYYYAHVYTLEERPIEDQAGTKYTYLIMQEGTGQAGRMMKKSGHKIALTSTKSLVAWAARIGKSVLVSDVFQEPNWLPNALLPETKSELAVPIKLGEQVLGVLDVQNDIVNGLTEEDQLLLLGLCGQIAVAIDYRRTEAERQQAEATLSQRAEEMTALYQTALEINAELDVPTLLRGIVHRAATLLSTEMGTLFLLKSPNDDVFEVVAVHNRPKQELGQVITLGQGATGRIAQTGDPFIIRDYNNWPGRLDRLANEPVGRLLGVPLKQGEQIIGVLNVFDTKAGDFQENEVQLLNLFATYASVVIQNARLFEAEQRQREMAETLGEITRVINSSLELQEVLDQILVELEHVISYDAATVSLIEDNEVRIVAAQHLLGQEKIINKPLLLTKLPLFIKVIQQQQPLLVPDTVQEPHFKPPLEGVIPARCLILIPLIIRERIIGILSLLNYTPNGYNNADLKIVLRFGQQVVVAIDNAQLYEQTQQYNFKLEQRIAERTAELNAAQKQLIQKEKFAVLGKLAGGVAHELRNPLGVIANAVYFLQAAQTEKSDEVTIEYLNIISTWTRQAENIISDLIDFSHLQSPAPKEIAILDLATAILKSHPPPDTIKVVLNINLDLPPVFIDPRQMGQQVLANLLTNAYHAMSEGGVLTLSAKAESHYIRFSVIDTGHGMSSETLQKIFEPLFSTKNHGIGLGLAISKNLVEINNCHLEVESVEGQGTNFTIILPHKNDV